MTGNQVRNQELLFVEPAIDRLILGLEGFINFGCRFSHRFEGRPADVLRGNFQLATDVMGTHFVEES